MNDEKPHDGVYVETVNDFHVTVTGYSGGVAVLKGAVLHGHEPTLTTAAPLTILNVEGARRVQALLAGVLEAIELAQREMVRVDNEEASA